MTHLKIYLVAESFCWSSSYVNSTSTSMSGGIEMVLPETKYITIFCAVLFYIHTMQKICRYFYTKTDLMQYSNTQVTAKATPPENKTQNIHLFYIIACIMEYQQIFLYKDYIYITFHISSFRQATILVLQIYFPLMYIFLLAIFNSVKIYVNKMQISISFCRKLYSFICL